MNTRITTWIRRYLPGEICSQLMVLVSAQAMMALSGNDVLVSFAAAWGANVGFYGAMIVTEWREHDREMSAMRRLGLIMRNLMLEFGMSEMSDSFLVRPALMYMGIQLLGNATIGVIVGGFAADFAFYLPTIVAYELRRKYLSN